MDLLVIKKVETSHYSWSKSFNRLTSDQNSDRKQYYYWQYYLHQTAQNHEYSERAGTVIVYQMGTPNDGQNNLDSLRQIPESRREKAIVNESNQTAEETGTTRYTEQRP